MASLTETSYLARRGINIGIIALVSIIFLKVGFGFAWDLWIALNPPPAPPPNVAFDVLPDINFPQSTSSATFAYTVDTVNGRLPAIPPVGKVYFIAIPKENLQSLNRANQLAAKLKFNENSKEVVDTIREWVDPKTPLRTLRMDIATGNFAMRYDWANDSTIFNSKDTPTEDQAKNEAQNLFQTLEILPKELQNGKTQISYWKASVNKLDPADSVSSADFTRIDYLRDKIDDFPVLGDSINLSPLYVMFSGDNSELKRIVDLHFTLWEIDKENYGTYPLRTAEQAWNDLRQGKGYIANIGTSGSNQINVKKIYLAYYYPNSPMNFLEPIYVFEGEKGFVAYVPAVLQDWLQKVAPISNL